jgi:ketosteroid isomerase-like protein
MKALTTLLVVGMFLTTVAMADDVDDVKAATLEHFAAVNSGDADEYIKYYLPEFSVFSGGGLLSRRTSLVENKKSFQDSVNAGFKRNLQLRNLEVRIYGNTAVTTSYMVGTVTQPDGTTSRAASQRTGVLVKQAGQWKEVHNHRSPLLPQ